MGEANGTTGGFAPFAAVEIPFSSIPPSDTPEYAEFLAHYLTAAFKFVRDTPGWKKTKSFSSAAGGNVQCKVLPSQVSQIAKKGWHLRESQHAADCGLTFDDWRKYIRFEHTLFEKQYIEDITLTDCVAKVKPDEAEIWHNAYKLPIVTADRDFVEMLLTIDLPAHAEPFSVEHEAATLAWIRDPQRALIPSDATTEPAHRSFVVLQFPVDHPDVPADPHKVRAVYSSFEAVSEAPAQGGDGKVVDWKMAVQSDTRGRIPTMMQEMAMPGEIAHDVPAFIEWAVKYKQQNAPQAH
ncbi:uncharacterized protein PAN0_003c2085 [Moesziomyces antarcticus]|uniref:DUF3074 domain-containing protein n=1 Tax=Pseudozyma antarctica TaxID=84753 RepID=A0A5C3FJG4_PSEA2|nr:uncharacterized protein PAN0_003c2085 [Moesziomyces antarcticus]GAK63876.1 conserved hypothetical protein [Moesziomyces antarcticus]SPO44484.1 uncharacterized protein PSANT_02169 [Moesziomyces antarcticus]